MIGPKFPWYPLVSLGLGPPRYVGICGQGPSDHPDLAKWLMEQGIDSVSLNPDSAARSFGSKQLHSGTVLRTESPNRK